MGITGGFFKGDGDMEKAVYDADLDDIVDDAELALRLKASLAAASNDLRKSSDAQVEEEVETYAEKKSITIPTIYGTDQTFRIKFRVKNAVNGQIGYAKIYKNDVAHGTEQWQNTNPAAWKETTEDLVFSGGDTCELYLKAGAGGGVYCDNFRVYCVNTALGALDPTW